MSDATITISTHVLDTSLGRPAAGVGVLLRDAADGRIIGEGRTNADGRITALVPDGTSLPAGVYELVFAVAEYLAASSRESFYPSITIAFSTAAGPRHYHVPLLLNPFGYSTYRGS